MAYPKADELKAFIQEELGVLVDSVDEAPAIIGHVSLERYGFIGALIVYRDDAGMVRAAPVPFSLCVLEVGKHETNSKAA